MSRPTAEDPAETELPMHRSLPWASITLTDPRAASPRPSPCEAGGLGGPVLDLPSGYFHSGRVRMAGKQHRIKFRQPPATVAPREFLTGSLPQQRAKLPAARGIGE